MKKLILCGLAAFATLATPAARASIVIVAPTTTTTGLLTITAPIPFKVTTAGTAFVFVLQSLVQTDDGSRSFDVATTPYQYTLNGTALSANTNFADNFSSGTFSTLKATDGYLTPNNGGFAVAVGDTFTILTGSYVLPTVSNFNPQVTQTFNGSMYLVGSSGAVLSAPVTVPEPSTWAMLGSGLAGLGLVLRQRRQRAA